MDLEYKTFSLTELKIDPEGDDNPSGSFEGYTSVFGTVDAVGDTVDKGAYKDTIPQFLKRGFVSWAHNWAEPIGLITEAREDEHGLFIKGVFHSDPDSQRYRLRVKERLDHKKFMGLSIGYKALEVEPRKVRKYRNAWGEETDMARALKKVQLFESALVMVPAEEHSGVTGIKAYDGGYIPSFEEHTRHVQVDVEEWHERLKAVIAYADAKEGRAISAARRARISSVAEALRLAAQEIDAMLDETNGASRQDDDEADSDSEPEGADKGKMHDAATMLALAQLERFGEIGNRYSLPSLVAKE